jgi:hypothetical protein
MFDNHHVMMVAAMPTMMDHYNLLFGMGRQDRQARPGK